MTRRLTASEYTEIRAALLSRGSLLADLDASQLANPDRVAESKATVDYLIRSLDRARLEVPQ